jgi:hypothetical protein
MRTPSLDPGPCYTPRKPKPAHRCAGRRLILSRKPAGYKISASGLEARSRSHRASLGSRQSRDMRDLGSSGRAVRGRC